MAAFVQIDKKDYRKRPWTADEDTVLLSHISLYGEGRWEAIAKASGLERNGKSCRLRWLNYLRPDLKHTKITSEEELLIIDLQKRWGNRWSRIAQCLPGRTDNEIKNYFRNHIQKKVTKKGAEDGDKRSSIHCDGLPQAADSRFNNSNSIDAVAVSEGIPEVGIMQDNSLKEGLADSVTDWMNDAYENNMERNEISILSNVESPPADESLIEYNDRLWNIIEEMAFQ